MKTATLARTERRRVIVRLCSLSIAAGVLGAAACSPAATTAGAPTPEPVVVVDGRDVGADASA
ncbi:MAG: hypothetical protein ACREM1_06570, partial [Longimicrobiales bacterium]